MESSVTWECSCRDSEWDGISQGWLLVTINSKLVKEAMGKEWPRGGESVPRLRNYRHKSCGWKTAQRQEEDENEYEHQHSFEGMSWLKYLNVG